MIIVIFLLPERKVVMKIWESEIPQKKGRNELLPHNDQSDKKCDYGK